MLSSLTADLSFGGFVLTPLPVQGSCLLALGSLSGHWRCASQSSMTGQLARACLPPARGGGLSLAGVCGALSQALGVILPVHRGTGGPLGSKQGGRAFRHLGKGEPQPPGGAESLDFKAAHVHQMLPGFILTWGGNGHRPGARWDFAKEGLDSQMP